MAYNIYKLIKSFPPRDQAVAELYSIGAIVSDQAVAELYSIGAIVSEGMPDFGVGPNARPSPYIIPGYTLVEEK